MVAECDSDMRLQLIRGRLRQGIRIPQVDVEFLRANPPALQQLRNTIAPQLRAKVNDLLDPANYQSIGSLPPDAVDCSKDFNGSDSSGITRS